MRFDERGDVPYQLGRLLNKGLTFLDNIRDGERVLLLTGNGIVTVSGERVEFPSPKLESHNHDERYAFLKHSHPELENRIKSLEKTPTGGGVGFPLTAGDGLLGGAYNGSAAVTFDVDFGKVASQLWTANNFMEKFTTPFLFGGIEVLIGENIAVQGTGQAQVSVSRPAGVTTLNVHVPNTSAYRWRLWGDIGTASEVHLDNIVQFVGAPGVETLSEGGNPHLLTIGLKLFGGSNAGWGRLATFGNELAIPLGTSANHAAAGNHTHDDLYIRQEGWLFNLGGQPIHQAKTISVQGTGAAQVSVTGGELNPTISVHVPTAVAQSWTALDDSSQAIVVSSGSTLVFEGGNGLWTSKQGTNRLQFDLRLWDGASGFGKLVTVGPELAVVLGSGANQAAPGNHTHANLPYLPLSGGTLTGDVTISHGGNSALYINSPTSPRVRLDIGGGAVGFLWAFDNTLSLGPGSEPNSLHFRNNNVGIGTVNPASKLHVAGSLVVNGSLNLAGASWSIWQNGAAALEFWHQTLGNLMTLTQGGMLTVGNYPHPDGLWARVRMAGGMLMFGGSNRSAVGINEGGIWHHDYGPGGGWRNLRLCHPGGNVQIGPGTSEPTHRLEVIGLPGGGGGIFVSAGDSRANTHLPHTGTGANFLTSAAYVSGESGPCLVVRRDLTADYTALLTVRNDGDMFNRNGQHMAAVVVLPVGATPPAGMRHGTLICYV